MKNKILFLLASMLLLNPCYAADCNIVCPTESTSVIENEKVINKVTGMGFLSKQIAEFVIQKELKEQLDSKFIANLDVYNVQRLKKGEFESLTLKSKQIQYKALYMSDFYAKTLCPFNKVIYENKNLYYPNDLAFKFTSKITNNDIKNVLNSYEFKSELMKNTLSYGDKKIFEIQNPTVEIKENQLFFNVPIYSFIWEKPYELKLTTDLNLKDNKLVTESINILSKSNMVAAVMFGDLVNKINPLAYEFNSIDTKYCKIFITNAKIENDHVNIEGVFIINKNYGEVDE